MRMSNQADSRLTVRSHRIRYPNRGHVLSDSIAGRAMHDQRHSLCPELRQSSQEIPILRREIASRPPACLRRLLIEPRKVKSSYHAEVVVARNAQSVDFLQSEYAFARAGPIPYDVSGHPHIVESTLLSGGIPQHRIKGLQVGVDVRQDQVSGHSAAL